MEANALTENLGYIALFNAALVGVLLVAGGLVLSRGALTEGVPDGRQNFGEFILNFFVSKARDMGDHTVVRRVAPFLATCFLFIFVSNLMGVIPLPILNTPPTSYFSVTLALALCSVGGTLLLSGLAKGFVGAVKHLFWPNPMQWISEVTDVMSLSLRLFGNIAGEHLTLVLVMAVIPVGIPLVLHALGLIPAFVQALVFTLLTSSFIASAIHHEEAHEKKRGKHRKEAQEKSEGRPDVASADAPVSAATATPPATEQEGV